jgi:hypothetical protein
VDGLVMMELLEMDFVMRYGELFCFVSWVGCIGSIYAAGIRGIRSIPLHDAC